LPKPIVADFQMPFLSFTGNNDDVIHQYQPLQKWHTRDVWWTSIKNMATMVISSSELIIVI
jgi:hypothetical protein